ncbi:uncharacterized protein LOC133834024 [Humulus lupulus]|uniref:uncharacterized protein LOC133834024 n=1 Tax=Humulus lupulus TaxID=3486 RepID=UPI002B4027FC|nr:uncharacterized protein LOC133834024 [Humulus lupulus]
MENNKLNTFFLKKNIKDRISYCVRLIASVDCIRFFVRQGLAFHGHDESQESNNQGTFLTVVSNVVNVVGASSKRRDILQEKQALKVIEALKGGELLSGRGQNQESGIKCPCDTRWGSHFGTLFNIDVLDMNHMYCPQGKSQRKAPKLTNFHYFRVDFFNTVLDLQLQEVNSRFNEANTELILCLECLSPANSFSAFDKGKLIRLAQLYPCDFSTMDIKKLVEAQKDKVYPLVYLLIKLALTLPLATALVERAFSAMNIVKNQMRNKMRD